MHKKLLALSAILILPALVASCAQRPSEEIQAADNAVAQARTGDVKDYAPESYKSVETAYASMQAEVETQDGKFAMTRSYDKAKELADEVKSVSDQAIADAAAAKERAKTQAADSVQQATAALDEAKTMLAQAPTGKGTKADLDAMKADLAGVETAIQEAQAALDQGSYLEAQAKADSAAATARQVTDAITMAKTMKAGAR